MKLITLLAAAAISADQTPTLILEKLRPVLDPRIYDLRDQVNGDRGVPKACALANNVVVRLELGRDNTTLEVDRDGNKRTIVVERTSGLGRSTLACGMGDDFYYANPRLGRLHAYSANRLFRGEDPVVWTRSVEPFKSLDAAGGVLMDASIATAVQVRHELVLLEWFFRQNGTTDFWHEVFDAATGAELEKIGPSDLLLKLNERDPWWIVFQGGGNEIVNYVPQSIYRLKHGLRTDCGESAAVTIERLRKLTPSAGHDSPLRISPNPVINHMIALLSPTRTSPDSRVEFCPTVPPQRARHLMGGDYDQTLAQVARDVLLAVYAERQTEGVAASPLDAWFQAEIASAEPMKTVLKRFNPQDDAWVTSYQQALHKLAGPTLESWLKKYGTGAGVVRTPMSRDSQ